MALGASLSTVTITGTYINYAGDAIEGQIRFATSPRFFVTEPTTKWLLHQL
jgi:hypothetical protein